MATESGYGYVYDGNVSSQQFFDVNNSGSQNLLPKSVLDSILKNVRPSISPRYAPTNIAKDIVVAFTQNYSKKVDQYYQYGLNHHSDWIPSNSTSHFTLPSDNEDGGSDYTQPHEDIPGIIETQAGEPIDITWYDYNYPNQRLLTNYFLNASPLYEVHGRNAVAAAKLRFTELSSGNIYIPNRYTFIGGILTAYCYRTRWVEFTPEDGQQSRWIVIDRIEYPFSFNVQSMLGFSEGQPLHIAVYTLRSTRDYGIWVYVEDGTYPNVDGSQLLPYTSTGSYPFAMIVDNGRTTSKGALGNQYQVETENLLKKIDINLNTLMDQLVDPDDPDALDASGNLTDVKDAFVSFSVNIENDSEGTLQYLYEHFRDYYYKTYDRQDIFHSEWIALQGAGTENLGGGSNIVIATNRVQFQIRFRWIKISVKNGNVDSVTGAPSDITTAAPYVSEIDANNAGQTSVSNGVNIGKVTKEFILGNEYGMNETYKFSHNTHYMILRKQLTETTYVELIVMGLSHVTYITGYNTDGTLGGRGYDYVINTLATMENGDFFLPLSYDVMQKFNSILRSRIFYESLTLTFHLYTITKLPWYANNELMNWIRVFLFIATWGTSEAWVQGLFEVVKHFIINLVIQTLLVEVVGLIADLVGGEVAIIIAAIAATVAITTGEGSSLSRLFDLVNAETLMQGATLLIQAVNQSVKDDFLELQAEAEAHADYVEAEQTRIEELEALIDTGITTDVTSIVRRQPLNDPYETPTDFYNRSVHVTNPGVLSLDSIDSYTSNLLKLPEFKPEINK